MKADVKLKVNRFVRKYGKIIAITVFIWLFIIMVNKFLGNRKNLEPTTTYEPHVSVLDSNSSAPKKVQNAIEDFIDQYVKYCNEGKYEEAYAMISEDCKNDNFKTISQFKAYVSNKFSNEKIYTIQNYSNYKDKYIYSIKLYDDILATGLSNSSYKFQEEKVTASYDKSGNVVFSVGNFIEKQDVKSVQENDYIKVDVKSKSIRYGFEIYDVKFTNRSEHTIIIENGQVTDEVILNTGADLRKEVDATAIIIEPNSTTTASFTFSKFFDDNQDSQYLIFNSIRVVDNYIEDSPNEDNAIYKFSMQIGLQ